MKDQKKNAKNGKAAKTTQKAAKFTPQDQWQLRVNLLPKNIAQNNKDRRVYQIMCKVILGVILACIISQVALFLATQVSKNNTENERRQTETLTAEKNNYSDVQKILTALKSTKNAKLGVIYNEADWKTIAENLEGALPDGGKYTALELKEYTENATSSSSSSSSNSTWAGTGSITITFTARLNQVVSAKDFIQNYEKITGYVSGNVTSMSNDDKNGITYTGSIKMKLDGNSTSRSNDSGKTDSERKEIESMRKQYESSSK